MLSEQADAICESAAAVVALDRRDIEAAWRGARATLDAPHLPSSGERRPG